ncbi:hypothetical protein B0T16DRAFT_288753, partial [Cercophora newfieldiana]
LIAAALLPLFSTTLGHSWPEATFRIAPNGTMIGAPGYARKHGFRGEVADPDLLWLIPPNGRDGKIHDDDKIVRANQRALTDASYSDKAPMLKVAPGDFVAIQYTENGHVSRSDEAEQNAKPVNRGTIYLYGTTTASDLTNYNLKDIHLVWNADGTGGDGKGRLLATRNFDDGQCYEPIPGTDRAHITTNRMAFMSANAVEPPAALACQSDLQIPLDVSTGDILTILWVWDWPTMTQSGVAVSPASYDYNADKSGPPHAESPEIYTGVVDYKIVDPCDPSLGEVKGPTCGSSNNNGKVAVRFTRQRTPNVAAIRAQMLNPFLVDVPQAGKGAQNATANPSDIPLGALIGTPTKPTLPLPTSFFRPIDAFQDAQPVAEPSESPQPTTESPQPTTTEAAKPSTTKSSESSKETTTAAPAPTTKPAPPGFNEKILTVTVTVPATTLYVTETATSTATGAAGTGN